MLIYFLLKVIIKRSSELPEPIVNNFHRVCETKKPFPDYTLNLLNEEKGRQESSDGNIQGQVKADCERERRERRKGRSDFLPPPPFPLSFSLS